MRDVNTLKGLHSVRTIHSAKKRSIPRIQSSAYLDMYMMDKEKERLLKDMERMDMKNVAIKKRLEEIDLELNKLRKAEPRADGHLSGQAVTRKSGTKKEWKTLSLSY